ncbi:MAG: DUF2183 domain-containing protein [Verrucomicrobiota bacterium JB023]|nr:DUF2183 domain-containing protein [Verrucomicrobiota bacterium JB023]
MGWNQPRQIVAYKSRRDDEGVHIGGRVLANKQYGGPKESDSIWTNLKNTYRRWESDEVPHVPVTISYRGEEVRVESDDEGYFEATLSAEIEGEGKTAWAQAKSRVETEEGSVEALHDVLEVSGDARFGVISDIDDTILHTGITSLFTAAKLTFLENARTRKPLEGAAEFYQALTRDEVGQFTNPLFYISSSPWNLYDLLVDFIDLNKFPAGPLFLRDVGIDRTKFIKSAGHGHKLDNALKVLDGYPDLKFVLIGDSGQDDAELYLEAARKRAGRIKAIYIRDVDPDQETAYDEKVGRFREEAQELGVHFVMASDSMAMARDAVELGLLEEADLKTIRGEVAADVRRPTAQEQAADAAVS